MGTVNAFYACARSARKFTCAAVSVVVLAGVVACSPPPGSEPMAAPTVTPVQSIRGERLTIIGALPEAQRRPVMLQHETALGWVPLEGRDTSSSGAYRFTTRARWAEANLRVVAVPALIGEDWVPELVSERLEIVTVVQSGVLTAPASLNVGEPAAATATFQPPRPGRPVHLQRQVGGLWETLASAEQDETGAARLDFAADQPGAAVLRAVTEASNGAPEHATSSVDVLIQEGGEVQELGTSAIVSQGSLQVVDISSSLNRVTELAPISSPDGVAIAHNVEGEVVVSASSATAPGTYEATAGGRGCVGETCDVAFRLTVTVQVTPITAVTSEDAGITVPSPDRIAASTDLVHGMEALPDEVLLSVGTTAQPGPLSQAQSIAESVGAVVTGSVPGTGVYELRWPSAPDDLDAVMDELRSIPGVDDVTPSVFGGLSEAAIPSDWNDDGTAIRWPFEQTRSVQAWDLAQGSSTRVGIVDGGPVWGGHEDLNVVDTLNADAGALHATHVAGLACARQNSLGVVGAAWGCPIVTRGLSANTEGSSPLAVARYFDKEVLARAAEVASKNVRVINMSLGFRANSDTQKCVSQSQSDEINQAMQSYGAPFRRLFNGPIGRNVVWTLSAGNNCGRGIHSVLGVSWALPNVITVAASNSDGTLASFSNFGPGVEVAAAGGVGVGVAGGEKGVISTTFKKCGLFSWFTCSDYSPDFGTSMAAPMVAGVAALAISAAPHRTAADIGSCITSTAGTNTPTVTSRSSMPTKAGDANVTPSIAFSGSIAIIDAEAAVKCATSQLSPSGDVLIAGQGDRTGSGNGTDRGDLFAALSAAGHDVVSAAELPMNLDGFEQVWHLDTEALTDAEQDRIAEFVAQGNGLYLTGEWGCCRVDSSTIGLVNRLVSGANVSHGGSTQGDMIIGADAPFTLGTTPHRVESVRVSLSGSLVGVAPGNTVGAIGPSVVSAAWGGSQVSGGGRIAVVMDINWIAEQYRGESWGRFIENLARFLEG